MKTKSSRNIEMMAAWPGIRLDSFDSSLRLTVVSHPQKKNTARAAPAASAVYPWMLPGQNQPALKLVDPFGWDAATLMIPPMEKARTAMYSMITRIHCKLVVHRMP